MASLNPVLDRVVVYGWFLASLALATFLWIRRGARA
jgi:hypothetical protein